MFYQAVLTQPAFWKMGIGDSKVGCFHVTGGIRSSKTLVVAKNIKWCH